MHTFLRRFPVLGSGPTLLTLVLVYCLGVCPTAGQSLVEYRKQVARLIQDYQWSDALEMASHALARYPQDPELLVAAAALMLKQGRSGEGERLLETAVSLRVSDPDLLCAMAGLKSTYGQTAAALKLLREALQRAPEQPVVHYRLSRLLFAEGEDEQALTHIARAVELDSSRSDYREFYALLLERGDKLKEAHEQLRLARHRTPFSARILRR
jgi:tetratricopeptide (TPR) repeat protein